MIGEAPRGPAGTLRPGASLAGVLPAPYPATQAALTVTAALAPAYVVRWHVGPLPTTLLEAAILVTIATFAVESLRAGTLAIPWRSGLAPPAALFLVAGAIAVFAGPSRVAALGIYRAYVVEPVALALVLLAVVRTSRQAWLVVGGLWAGACVLALANADVVLQAVRLHRLDPHVPAPVAVYLSPNSVALYLVPLLAVGGAAALHAPSRVLRAVAAAFVVVALPASVLTFSRGGWLAIAAVLAGLALSHRRRWWLLAGLAVVGVGVAAVPEVSHRAVLLLQQGAGNTSGDRLKLWTLTLHLLSQRPLLGMGLAGFQPTVVPLWPPNDADWILYPHNLALDLWAETGLLGLLSFAWVFGATAVVAWLGWRQGGAGWRPLHLGVLIALLAVLVHGAVDNPYFKNDLSLEFWALAALTWAGRPRRER